MKAINTQSAWLKGGAVTLLALALGACGGSGSNSGSASMSSGVSYGKVTGFGSVTVNGTHFEAQQIKVNGQVASKQDLTSGMLVSVEGEWDGQGSGTASLLEYDDNLRGKVTKVMLDTSGQGSITVLGQTVLINDKTVFTGESATTISTGDGVSVSGWYLGNGEFRASLIQVGSQYANPNDVELEGEIRQLDAGLKTFFIGAMEVNYSAVPGDLSVLANGQFVEVEGRLEAGVFKADELELEDGPFDAKEGDDVELSGPIAKITASGFMLNGVEVLLEESTEQDEELPATLTVGLYVEVEGEWNAQGQLVAEEIETREADASVEATISAKGQQSLTVGGVTVRLSDLTMIVNDGDDNSGQVLAVTDLAVGDVVEVEGIVRTDTAGNVSLDAFKIERDLDGGDGNFELEGTIGALDVPNSLTVLGVTLQASSTTYVGVSGITDLQLQSEVEVTYQIVGGVATASLVKVD